MKYFLSFLFVVAMLVSGFSQEQVIGRSMVLKTSGHPDSIPSLSAPAVNFGNAVVLDTVSGDMYTFNYATEAWQKMVSENSVEARPYRVYTAVVNTLGVTTGNIASADVVENTTGLDVGDWTSLGDGVFRANFDGDGIYDDFVKVVFITPYYSSLASTVTGVVSQIGEFASFELREEGLTTSSNIDAVFIEIRIYE